MHYLPSKSPTIAIVDPSPDDYGHLVEAARRYRASIHFFATAAEALRFGRQQTISLWTINVELPDLSGLDICGMIKSLSSHSVIYMVTARYRAEDERIARIRGASLFISKPICVSWFEAWWAGRFSGKGITTFGETNPSVIPGYRRPSDRPTYSLEPIGGSLMKQS